MTKPGVLLFAFGGPRSREEVRPFLDDVLRSHPVPKERYEQVAAQYDLLGGVSPLHAAVSGLARDLEGSFRHHRLDWPVYVGMRHGPPALAEALDRMVRDGVGEAAVVIPSSFRSEPSWDRYVRALEEAGRAAGGSAPRFHFLEPWNEDPLFVQAVADRILEAQAALPLERQKKARWLFSAHSIPLPLDEKAGYSRQLLRTAELVARRLDRDASAWRLVYQSRSGHPQDPWLEPDVTEVLRDPAGSERKDVLVIPLGFPLENAEVAYDLNIRARAAAEAAGLNFLLAKTVGGHPHFVEILARGARTALGAAEPA